MMKIALFSVLRLVVWLLPLLVLAPVNQAHAIGGQHLFADWSSTTAFRLGNVNCTVARGASVNLASPALLTNLWTLDGQTNYPLSWFSPTPPVGMVWSGGGLAAVANASQEFTVTCLQAIPNPRLHVANLDSSQLTVTTPNNGVSRLSGNAAFVVTGNVLNSDYGTSANVGCQADNGTNPGGACGTVEITGSYSTLSFLNSRVASTGSDGWVWNLSANTLAIGGTVSGLGVGKSLVLQNNLGDDVTVSANTTFSFALGNLADTTYAVTVKTQPTDQICTVTRAAGTAIADVTDVLVTCTARVVPDAPIVNVATPGNGQATVSFTPPAFDGGAPITGYTVSCSPGGITATGAASPITVTGLSNGTAYTCSATATNSIGVSLASAASNTFTPVALQTISFSNPGAQNFGTTPTLTASSSAGLTVGFSSATPGVCTVTSGGVLTFVSAGTCSVNANQAGSSVYGAAPQVTQSFSVLPVLPGAPTMGTATAGNGQATVSFTAPASSGGSAITGYTVTCSPGGASTMGASSPITVAGLTNGTAYTCSVTATHSVGTGPASAPSNTVTPVTVPGVPTITTVTPGNGQATVSFTAPASNGGASITGYTVSCSPGGITATRATSPITVTGLSNGTAYTCSVTATNSAGTGSASAPSGSVTPFQNQPIPTLSQWALWLLASLLATLAMVKVRRQ